MDEQDLQKKYMEYNRIGEKLKELEEERNIVDQQLFEIIDTANSLDELNLISDGSEILVPVNKGIFAKARFEKENKLYVNVGANAVVDKSYAETKSLIEKQKEGLANLKQRIADTIRRLANRAGSLEKELNESIPQIDSDNK